MYDKKRATSFKSGVETSWVGFDKLFAIINNQEKIIRNTAVIGEIKAAEDYRKYLKETIRTGAPQMGYKPVSQDYWNLKASKGIDKEDLNLTGTMVSSIKIKWTKRGNVAVGILPGGRSNAPKGMGGLTPLEYARILETGQGEQPPRPVFKDSFRHWGGKARIVATIRASAELSVQQLKAGKPLRIGNARLMNPIKP